MTTTMQKRTKQRTFKQIAQELEELAIQTDCTVYLGDKKIDNYVRLSDVIDILQKHAQLNFPLLNK